MLSALISSVLSYAALPLMEQLPHHMYVNLGPLVLEIKPLNFPAPTVDKDRTVSRRSKPNSCTTLIGEQPNPWYPLLHQDLISRHRGAKLSRRYGSQGQLACYPWRTFYPLIDDHSILYHRITMTTLSLCSICKSNS